MPIKTFDIVKVVNYSFERLAERSGRSKLKLNRFEWQRTAYRR